MQLVLTHSTIRPFRVTDAESIVKHAGTYSVARNMCAIPHPYTLQHAHEWIGIATGHSPQTHFAITVDDEVVGGIGLDVGDSSRFTTLDHSAEIGYWLGESHWGRGIVSEVVAALSEWAFSELGLIRLQAGVFARNPASVRVLTKAGFEFEGRLRARYRKDGELIDGLMYAKLRLPG